MPARHPKPLPTPLDTPYWKGLSEGEIRIQLCAECGTYHWYPRPVCSVCYSEKLEWQAVSGAGKLFTYTITHQRTGFAFDEALPFVVGVVALDDAPGVRLTGLVKDLSGEPEIGMPLRAQISTVESGDTTYGVVEFSS